MTKAEKTALIETLVEKFNDNKFFYITDYSTLTAKDTNQFRRLCFENDVEMQVVKNTLIKKALERVSDTDYQGLYDSLKGPSAILFSVEGKAPATVIKTFRKTNEMPLLKAAYIDTAVYLGDDKIDELSKLKSKADLLGELIGLLQSPMSNVMGQLGSGKDTIFGLLKTLSEKEGGTSEE